MPGAETVSLRLTSPRACVCATLKPPHGLLRGIASPTYIAPSTNIFDGLDELLRGIAAVGELTTRTSDLIVSYGERLSSLVIAAAFAEKGIASAHVDARTVIRTDGHHGKQLLMSLKSSVRCLRARCH